jgi:hypothetical protein
MFYINGDDFISSASPKLEHVDVIPPRYFRYAKTAGGGLVCNDCV